MKGNKQAESAGLSGTKETFSILVVYDDRDVVNLISSHLKNQGYFVSGADDGVSAVDIFVAMGGFDLVVSRRNLPDVDEEALRRMISDLYPTTKFLFFEKIQSFKGATSDFLRLQMIDLTISGQEFLELAEQVLTGSRSSLRRKDTEREQIKRCLFNVITLFSTYLEQYEFVSGGKGKFMKDLVVSVAHQMGLPADTVDEIAFASLVFDIGMVKVSPKVKLKPADLTDGELAQIKAHCFYGAEIVEKIKFPWNIAPIVLHHHERYDGKGYPRGLKGREIPIGSRIISVAWEDFF
ncbi:HD-GYP domain-containing protein [Acidobacteriota bacterium]